MPVGIAENHEHLGILYRTVLFIVSVVYIILVVKGDLVLTACQQLAVFMTGSIKQITCLCATKASHRYKKLTHRYNFGHRKCEAVNGNIRPHKICSPKYHQQPLV